jgi:hypothetical protein
VPHCPATASSRLLGKGVSGTDPKPKVQCPGTCSRNQTSNQGRIGTTRRHGSCVIAPCMICLHTSG